MKSVARLSFLWFALATLACGTTKTEWEIVSIGEDPLHDIEVLSDQQAVAYSYGTGNIYQTIDGGKTWAISSQLDSLYFEQTQFTDSKTGWLCGEQGKVYHTVDGGNTWIDRSPKITTEEGNLLLYALYFEGEKNGIVAGLAINFEQRTRAIYSFRTQDGGISWQKSSAPTMLMGIKKGPDGMIWAFGSQMILRKSNLNDDWEILLQNSAEQEVADIRSLDFSAQSGRVLALEFSKGNVWSTNDNGQTWASQPLTTNRLRSIQRYDKEGWLAVGDQNKEPGNIFFSKDDGISWQQDSTQYPDLHRLGISKNYLWAVGKEGFIGRRRR